MNLRFEWDEWKNTENKMKHGISFQTAVMVFSDPKRIEIFDWEHSANEDRWIITGFAGLSILTVIYTERDGIKRLISARKANKKEQEEYFNGYGTVYTN